MRDLEGLKHFAFIALPLPIIKMKSKLTEILEKEPKRVLTQEEKFKLRYGNRDYRLVLMAEYNPRMKRYLEENQK